MAQVTGIDLGTYRTKDGEFVHCWYDDSGVLLAERDTPLGTQRVDPRTLTTAVKLSDDPLWPDREGPRQIVLWQE